MVTRVMSVILCLVPRTSAYSISASDQKIMDEKREPALVKGTEAAKEVATLQPGMTDHPSSGFGETACDFSSEALAPGCLFYLDPWMWNVMMACAPEGCSTDFELRQRYRAEAIAYNSSGFGHSFPNMTCSNNTNVTQVAMIWSRDYDVPVLPPVREGKPVYIVICPRSSDGVQPKETTPSDESTEGVRARDNNRVIVKCRSEDKRAKDCQMFDLRR